MAQENATNKAASADYEMIVAQMTALRNDLAKLAQSVETIASARSQAFAADMTEGMAEAANYINRKSHDADTRIEGAVSANPYIALGLAAGMGMLIGALTRR